MEFFFPQEFMVWNRGSDGKIKKFDDMGTLRQKKGFGKLSNRNDYL